MDGDRARRSRLTAKGERTRARIVDAAVQLVRDNGVVDTTLEQIKKVAGVSSSQLYHYFADKDALVEAVIERQIEMIVATQEQAGLGTLQGMRAWRDSLVAHSRKVNGAGGDPLGHLVGQLAETDEQARLQLKGAFDRWSAALRDAMRRLDEGGQLRPGVDPDRLADTLLATLQGGFLLSQVRRDAATLETAVDTVLELAGLPPRSVPEGRTSAE